MDAYTSCSISRGLSCHLESIDNILQLKYGHKYTQSSRIIISLIVLTLGLITVPIAIRFLLKESDHKDAALWIFIGDIIVGGNTMFDHLFSHK